MLLFQQLNHKALCTDINLAEKTIYTKDSQAVMVSSSNDPIDFNDAKHMGVPSFFGGGKQAEDKRNRNPGVGKRRVIFHSWKVNNTVTKERTRRWL